MPRHAAPTAPDRIKTDLARQLAPRMLLEELCEQEDLDEWDEDETIVHGFQECATKAVADLAKISFSLENMTLDPDEPFGDLTAAQAKAWLGPQSIGDLTFIGCMGGGDWEEPVAFVIYSDGKDFRAYVPTSGNSFDIASKAAIGTAPAGAVARTFDIDAMRDDVAARIVVRS